MIIITKRETFKRLIIFLIMLNILPSLNLPITYAQEVKIIHQTYYTLPDWWYSVLGITPTNVLELPDGTAVFAGETSEDYIYDRKLILFRVDQFGGILWAKMYTYNNLTISPVSLVLDNKSKEIILGGQLISKNPEWYSFVVLKMSPNGSLIWATKYTFENPCELTSVRIDHTGNIYLAGSIQGNLFLIKTNPNGTPEWSRVYDSGGDDNSPQLSSIRQGKLVMIATTTGFRINDEPFFTSIWELMIDTKDGHAVWMNTYLTFKDEIAKGVSWVSPHLVAILGVMPHDSQNIILLTSSSGGPGNVIWSKSYNVDNVDYPRGSIKSHENKIIAGGPNFVGISINGDLLFSKVIQAYDFSVKNETVYAVGPGIIKFNLSKIYRYHGEWIWDEYPVRLQELNIVTRSNLVSSQLGTIFKDYSSKHIQVTEKRINVHIEPFNVQLVKKWINPDTGRINIITTPPGARVYIDNIYLGTTPILNHSIKIGNHYILLSRSNYSTVSFTVNIKSGLSLTLSSNLTLPTGKLSILNIPISSYVYLNNTLIGRGPIANYSITAGQYFLKIIYNNQTLVARDITIPPNNTTIINFFGQRNTPPPEYPSISSPLANAQKDDTTIYYLALMGTVMSVIIILLLAKQSKTQTKISLNFPRELTKKYEPLEFLGEGGFAKVFKVKRKKNKKIIALKVFSADEKAKKFFTKEVKAWKLLDHPNIVKLYNAFDEPIPHLEIEFIEGYTMDGKLIRDLEHYPKPVDEKLALKFIEGIAEGLRHAHSMQVYHRDLKPSNILLRGDLTPKITDFGLAKIGSKSTTTTTKALTPLYAAPEQIDERTYGHTDHRTDIYQLGVILYELLTGKLPYEGSSHVVVLAKITNPEIKPKPPSMYNLTLAKYDKMFEKLLAKQKEKRYQSLDEFLEEFRGLVELLKEREKLKESLRVTKETITKTRDELEIKKLNSELLRLLIQNTILSVRINDKEEALNGLYDLIPFTRKHRAELEEAIRQVQLFIEEGLVIPEEFIESLRILLHKIEREE